MARRPKFMKCGGSPRTDAFFAWLDGLNALPQPKLGVAVTYAKNQRKHLMNILADGGVEISYNRCERAVKPFVQGRKAWLFSNTPRGAEASSAMFSIAETAKENGLNPCYYKFADKASQPAMFCSILLPKLK